MKSSAQIDFLMYEICIDEQFNVLPLHESRSSSMLKYQSTFGSNFRGEGGVAAAGFHAATQQRLFPVCLVVLYKYSQPWRRERRLLRSDFRFWILRHFPGTPESVCWLVCFWSCLKILRPQLVISSLLQHSKIQRVQYNHITKPRWWQSWSVIVVVYILEGFQSILSVSAVLWVYC